MLFFSKAIYCIPYLFKLLSYATFFQEKEYKQLIERQTVSLLAQHLMAFEGSAYIEALKKDGCTKSLSEPNIKAALMYKVFKTN